MKTHRILAGAALVAMLLACDDSSPKALIAQGNTALGSGDPSTALAKFNQAISGLEATDAQYLDAKLGAISALAVGEPQRASEELKHLADAQPQQVGAKQYIYIGGQMVSAGHFEPAVQLIHEGVLRFAADAPALKVVIERIKREGAHDQAANKLLETLGYL